MPLAGEEKRRSLVKSAKNEKEPVSVQVSCGSKVEQESGPPCLEKSVQGFGSLTSNLKARKKAKWVILFFFGSLKRFFTPPTPIANEWGIEVRMWAPRGG